ncbi:MAG: hypothetical protein L3K08_01400, partial [Thermoplasmata archaeon]|nr:hypothetical protein [Thermoplasmata archaeon]
MAGLFRRFRKDKATPAPEEEPVPDASSEPKPAVDEVEPPVNLEAPVAAAPEIATAATEPEVDVTPSPAHREDPSKNAERRPPPPLPKPASDGNEARITGGPGAFSRCFLCGSRLDGPWCPTCR